MGARNVSTTDLRPGSGGTWSASGFRLASETPLVGREALVEEVAGLLAENRLVTLTGVGGVGKSRLAWEFALRPLPHGMTSVEGVELAGVGDETQVAQTIVQKLGITDQAFRTPLDALATHFADERRLLIVDGCERAIEECATVLDELLEAAPLLTILATSRSALDLIVEVARRVPPLRSSLADDGGDADPDPRSPAVELFVARVARVAPERTIRPEDLAVIAHLCAALDGLPLAIELAAARTRSLSLADIVAHLDDRFALLTGSGRSLPARQRTLGATIDWSYQLCSPLERRVWRRLSLIVGSFGLKDAESLCASFIGPDADPRDAANILDVVEALVAQSVLFVVELDGRPRLRMLESLRAFGQRELQRAGETANAQEAHLDYVLAMAGRSAATWFTGDQRAILAAARVDNADVLRVLGYAAFRPEFRDRAATIFASLGFHWCIGGFLADGLETALHIASWAELSDGPRSRALTCGAWISVLVGRHELADAWLDESDRLANAHGDLLQVMHSTIWRGTLAAFRRDDAAASRYFDQVIEHVDLFPNPGYAHLASFQLTLSRLNVGRADAGEPARAAVAWAEESGECWIRAHSLWALGLVALEDGRLDAADGLARQAIEIEGDFGDSVGSGLMLELLAWTAAARGDGERAATLEGAVDALWRSFGAEMAPFAPHQVAAHNLSRRRVDRLLGLDRADELRAIGRGFPLPEAVRFALERPVEVVDEPEDDVLTPREREIVGLVALGFRNREVAERLHLSPRTVDGHLGRVMTKLDLHTRTAVVAWFHEQERRESA